MKRFSAVLLALSAVLATSSAPASAAPYCGIVWGSTPEYRSTMSDDELAGIRTGQHACFDRLVLDVDGAVGGYSVKYVDQLRQDGSGFVVPVRGGARLEVTALVPVARTDGFFTGAGTDAADVSGYRTFRQVAWVGSFEGHSTLGLGVRGRLPFRVLLLDGPGNQSRMVVDVAHRW